MTKKDLLDYFCTFGEVLDLSAPPSSEDSTKNRGCCFVKYADEKVIGEILQKDHILKNRLLYIKPYIESMLGIRTIVVTNLNYNATEEHLLCHFNMFGKVISLSVPPSSEDSTKNRGYCFVKYMDERVVDKVRWIIHSFNGNLLRIYPYNENMPYIGTVLAGNLDNNIKGEESLEHSIKLETE